MKRKEKWHDQTGGWKISVLWFNNVTIKQWNERWKLCRKFSTKVSNTNIPESTYIFNKEVTLLLAHSWWDVRRCRCRSLSHILCHIHTVWASIFKTSSRKVGKMRRCNHAKWREWEKEKSLRLMKNLFRFMWSFLSLSLSSLLAPSLAFWYTFFIASEGFIFRFQKWLRVGLFLTFVRHVAIGTHTQREQKYKKKRYIWK